MIDKLQNFYAPEGEVGGIPVLPPIARLKIPCGGFYLGAGLEITPDGKTLYASGGGGEIIDLGIILRAGKKEIRLTEPLGIDIGTVVSYRYEWEDTGSGEAYTFDMLADTVVYIDKTFGAKIYNLASGNYIVI